MKVVVNPKNNLKNNLTATVQGKNSVLVNQSVRRLSDMADVDLTGLEDGSLLIYSTASEKFEASRLLEKQNINGGHF